MKQGEKVQNYHQQVLAEAYNAKILSVQSENSGNTKDGEDQQTSWCWTVCWIACQT